MRLAVGALGLTETNRDGELADLIAARLSNASGFELVERRELDAVLKEASLSRSGLVRAKDAVRFGTLLRVDQFLLGTCAPISGTNHMVVRLVNGRTGVIEAITVFDDTRSLETLAGKIADFVRAENGSAPKLYGDYLAIGVIQNLGVNNRFSDFPAQMRGFVASHPPGKVTMLERDVISLLANEVRMDMAGLTETAGQQAPQMQFGFWIVDGFYQSYEVAEPEVQLKLRIERVQGAQQNLLLQGKPDEAFLTKICEAIGQALSQPVNAIGGLSPTRQGEIAALEARGRQLADHLRPGPGLPCRIQIRSAHNPDKVMSALDEATRVFESMLLLDPDNNRAKMRLAGCLLFKAQNWGGVARDHEQERTRRTRDLYREVIATDEPENANDARISLADSIGGLEGVEMLRRFASETTNPKEKARFRAYRDDKLLWQEYKLAIGDIMPHLQKQLIEELTDVWQSPKDAAAISYDHVLFAWRFKADKRQEIINALLPEIIERFPELKPHLLLAAAGEQISTNSPVIAKFLASLKSCEEQPEAVWHSSSYFTHLTSTEAEETDVRLHGGTTLYQRTFQNGQHEAVVAAALARKRAAEKGLTPPLTAIGKIRLAESCVALTRWKEALDVFSELPEATVYAKNECRRHLGLPTESEEVPDSAWKDKSDMKKVEIAYECIGRKQWSTAAAILDSIGHRTVRMSGGGAWGWAFTPVLPALVANECRVQAGKPPVNDPMRFELGETPYVNFVRDGARIFSFEMEGEDLWMATYSQIKMFRGEGPFPAAKPFELHEFERTTQMAVTAIAVSKDYLWAGTFDDGLVELDRKTGVCRRLTVKEGLLLNGISGLALQGQTLWIGYQNGENGAVGTLDPGSHKFSALTPNLSATAGTDSQPHYNQMLLDDARQAPRLPVRCMTPGDAGEMWFVVKQKGVQRFKASTGVWETVHPIWNHLFVDVSANLTGGLLLLANLEYHLLDGEKSRDGGLLIYDYRHDKTQKMQIYEGLPSNDISAVAADGRIAWVGGRGFVAVVDVQERKVLRIAYVSASRIMKIQLTPAHAWVAVSCGKNEGSDFAGDAWTGVYRLNRAEIEKAVYTASK